MLCCNAKAAFRCDLISAKVLCRLVLWLTLAFSTYADGPTQVVREQASEQSLVQLIETTPAAVSQWTTDDVVWMISRSWWTAARAFVTQSHEVATQAQNAALATAVRKEVNAMKQSGDALLLALSTQDREKLGTVQCAFQWAQNSSALFLSIKFSHRWSSPGALKVSDERVEVSDCCFNFSALGEHSQLHKKYGLNIHFYQAVDPNQWEWEFAAAGRMTVEIRKATPSNWPRLHFEKKWPKNMATWDSMESRWATELQDFDKAEAKRKRKGGNKGGGNDSESDADVLEEDAESMHRKLEAKCAQTASSLFKGERRIKNLCESYWPPKMSGSMGREALWLVLFYSSEEMKCAERSSRCTSVRDQWMSVQRRMWEVKGVHNGAIDCDLNQDFCKKQDLGHLPTVRRYMSGKRKTFYGEWEIDALMKFVE